MSQSEEFWDMNNMDIMQLTSVRMLVELLRLKYKMSDDSIIIFFTSVLVDDQKLGKDFILQNILTRRGLHELRDKIREEFLADKPKISQKDIEEYIRISDSAIKNFLAA